MMNPEPESSSSIESTQEIPAGQTHMQRIDPGRQNNDRYHLIRAHASGGLGRISVAVDQKFGRTVAYKEIMGARADSDRATALFLKEAEITAQLEHPGIVPIYDVGQRSDGKPYYAMRFIEGESLRAAISRVHGAGSRQSASWWHRSLRPLIQRLIEVCHAIQFAHSRGVLHRDIKPENIMLGRFGETLIVDWGLAKCLQVTELSEQSSGDVVGTVGYMSPEQAMSPENVSTATDIFSLGATLFAILAGKPSSKQTSMAGLRNEFQAGVLPCPSSENAKIPRPLAAICRKAMSLKPDDRYASVMEFAEEMQRWMDRENVMAYREPIAERCARWVGRRKALATGVVGLLLAGTIGLSVAGYGWLQQQRQSEENLVQVLKTTERFFDDTEDYLSDIPALTNLRLDLLEESASMHEAVLQNNPDNATVIYRTSEIYSKLADVYSRLEREADRAVAQAKSTTLSEDLYRFGDQQLLPEFPQRTARWWYFISKTAALKATENQSHDDQTVVAEVELLRRQIAADPLLTDQHRTNFEGTLASFTGASFLNQKDYEAAISQFQTAERIMKSVEDLNPVAFFQNQSGYAFALQNQGKLTEAIEVWTPLVEACRRGLEEKSDEVKNKTWRYNLANGLSLRSRAHMSVGHVAQAIEGCQESLEIHRQLATEYPGLPSHRVSAAGLELDLAVMYCRAGRISDSLPHYDRAISDLELLSRRYPGSDEYRSKLAGAYANKATAAFQSQKISEALTGYRKALELNRQIADASERLQDQYPVATSHLGYAAALTRSHSEYSEVKPHYEKAFAILEQLVTEMPQDGVYRRKLGLAIRNFGDLLSRQLDPLADQYLLRAEKLYSQIASQTEKTPELQFRLAQTADGRARIAVRFGRLQLSNELFAKAVEGFDQLWQQGHRMDNLNLKVVKVRRLIADNHRDMHQWKKARQAYSSAMKMADQVFQVDREPLHAERLVILHHQARMELKVAEPNQKSLKAALQAAEKIIVDSQYPEVSVQSVHHMLLSIAAEQFANSSTTADDSLVSLLGVIGQDRESASPVLQDFEAIEQQLEVQLFRLSLCAIGDPSETSICQTIAQLIQEYEATESEPFDCLATQDYAIQSFQLMCQRQQWSTALLALRSIRRNTSEFQFRTMLQAVDQSSEGFELVSVSENKDRAAICEQLKKLMHGQPRLKTAVETKTELNQLAERILNFSLPR